MVTESTATAKYKCLSAFTLHAFHPKALKLLVTWQVFWLGPVEHLPAHEEQWYEDSTIASGN
jgi:hypothetical protein